MHQLPGAVGIVVRCRFALGRCEPVAAHHLEECSTVGGAPCGEDVADLLEVVRAEDAGGRDLHDAGFTDLVQAHFAVLRYPGPDDCRPSDLAAEVGMTPQAMNYLLGQLEGTGYLIRDDDPDDRRSRRVRLTERGHAVSGTIRATVADIEADLEHELGREHMTQLRKLLTKLNASAFVRGSHNAKR